MSLDVYLEGDHPQATPAYEAIFVRREGATVEISREEWERLYPGKEPVTVTVGGHSVTLYSANITHNLGAMAEAAGIYQHLWRPEELGITRARELVAPLEAGLDRLKADPASFQVHNPSNGWGSYDALVSFVDGYLAACLQHPDAKVRASR